MAPGASGTRVSGALPRYETAPWRWALVIGLLLISTLVRFANVELSFYGDEETTAFAARSVLTEGHPAVPSGMDYNRAPLYSYMAAAAASVLGADSELAYRLPALLFGVLAVIALFAGTRRSLGFTTGVVAAILLATSEWHVVTSSYARMYSPYLALFVCTAFCFLAWSRGRSPLVLLAGVLFFLLSGSFQILTVFAVGLLVVGAGVRHAPRGGQVLFDVSLALLLAAVAIYLDGALVQNAYSEFATAMDGHQKSTVLGNVAIFWWPLVERLTTPVPLLALLALLAALAWIMLRRLPAGVPLPWRLGMWGCGAFVAAMVALGQMYATTLGLYMLTVLCISQDLSLRRLIPLATVLVFATAFLALLQTPDFMAALFDPDEQFLFPYLAHLLIKYPVLVLLALGAPFLTLLPATGPSRFAFDPLTTRWIVYTLALFFMLNVAAFGLLGQWYEDRYIVHTYPFLLLLAAYSIVVLVRHGALLLKLSVPLTALLGLLLLSLLMPHHLLQGLYRGFVRDHGSHNVENGRYFPDHAAPGYFVRERLQPDDVVIATDVLQQRWYVGQADYWLRSRSDVSRYIYQRAPGDIRDIYVHSRHLGPLDADRLLQGERRVWVIVSSVDVDEDWAMSTFEREFLGRVRERAEPLFTGRDGRSEVYLLEAGS